MSMIFLKLKAMNGIQVACRDVVPCEEWLLCLDDLVNTEVGREVDFRVSKRKDGAVSTSSAMCDG